MLDIEKTKKELENIDKLIELTKQTRDAAIKAKTEAETRVEMSKNELRELGITPENAQIEIENLEKQISQMLEQIKSEIPMDLLRQLKRID